MFVEYIVDNYMTPIESDITTENKPHYIVDKYIIPFESDITTENGPHYTWDDSVSGEPDNINPPPPPMRKLTIK